MTQKIFSGIVKHKAADKKQEKKKKMDFKVGEIIKMKKKHPCGANEWKLLRVGMDFRLQCMKCGREVMVPRKLVEKNFRGYISQDV